MKSTLFILLISFVIGSQAGILMQDFYQQGLSNGFTFNNQPSALSASANGIEAALSKQSGLVSGTMIQGLLYALFTIGLVVIAGELAERYYMNKLNKPSAR